MLSRDCVYRLPRGNLSVHINVTITTFARTCLIPEQKLGRIENLSFGAMPSLLISDLVKARQDLPYTRALTSIRYKRKHK